MMSDIMMILALIGSGIAGLWDLKTTEVPDEIPYVMTSVGLAFWYASSLMSGNYSLFMISLLVGIVLTFLGVIIYKSGQWGGADSALLVAIGIMVPVWNGNILMPAYIVNFLFVSLIYMLIYTIILGIMHREVLVELRKDLTTNSKFLLVMLGLMAAGTIYFRFDISFIWIASVIIGLFIFLRYAKIVESRLFKKMVPISKLKEGDVLETMIWRGLTKEEVIDLQRKRKNESVVVKEGVRFVPVFAITLLITALYGSIWPFIM